VHPQGHVLNDLSWGGFLEWNDSNASVFIDSRSEIYDEWGVLADYIDAETIRRPFEVLDRYRIQVVLFPKNERLSYLLARSRDHSSGWVVGYEDANSIVFERKVVP
jgi:hypothetical protein